MSTCSMLIEEEEEQKNIYIIIIIYLIRNNLIVCLNQRLLSDRGRELSDWLSVWLAANSGGWSLSEVFGIQVRKRWK